MSSSALGIPLNMGLTYGLIDENSYSLLCNALPETFMLFFNKPIEVDTYEELLLYTKEHQSNLIPGIGCHVKSVKNDEFGISAAQYIWTKNEWIKLGMPTVKEYLNIYDIFYESDEAGDIYPQASLFMRAHIKNIQSNVKLLSILNMKYAIKNNEIMAFVGLNGNYGINNTSKVENLLNSLLMVNIRSGLSCLFRRLLSMYDITQIHFEKFIESTVKTVEKVLDTTYYDFLNIHSSYNDIDVSMYINYIACAFASFKSIIKSLYNNSTLPATIEINNSLYLLDSPLQSRININSQLRYDFLELLQIIDDVVYRDSAAETHLDFYNNLKDVARYFTDRSEVITKTTLSLNEFCENLCEGIGGVIGLALYLSIFSNCENGSKTDLYLHFLTPEKYEEYL